MSGSLDNDSTAVIVERLISDPEYRLREAALWYFDFGTTEEAANSPRNPHDEAIYGFELIRSNAANGVYEAGDFERACEPAVDMLADPQIGLPLVQLVRDIGDPRVGANAVPLAVESAVVAWVCTALYSVGQLGPNSVRDAGNGVLDANLSDEVEDAIADQILSRSASELQSVVIEREALIWSLLERLENDKSVVPELIRLTDDLVTVARPWWALVDVFDDDPDSGDEGHVLDRIAGIVRAVSVAIYNRTDQLTDSRRLLDFAIEIGQSSSLKSALQGDARRLRYLAAGANIVKSMEAGLIGAAISQLTELQAAATTPEERAEAQQIASAVLRRSQTQKAASTSGSGCGSIIGGLFALVTIGGIIAAIVRSGGGASSTSDSPGSEVRITATSKPYRPVTQPYNPITQTVDTSSEIERLAIERERSRLEGVASDLDQQRTEIDGLESSMHRTEIMYPNGAPDYIVAEYERQRLRHNNLVSQYNDLLTDYQSDLDAFNRRVDAYNAR